MPSCVSLELIDLLRESCDVSVGVPLMLKILSFWRRNLDSHRAVEMLGLQRASMSSQSRKEAMVHGNTLSHVLNTPNSANLGLLMCQFLRAGCALLAPPPRLRIMCISGFHRLCFR